MKSNSPGFAIFDGWKTASQRRLERWHVGFPMIAWSSRTSNWSERRMVGASGAIRGIVAPSSFGAPQFASMALP
jgi:hypothetical protein